MKATSMELTNQAIIRPFGKRIWVISELKDILDIQLLHLRCHAPTKSYNRDGTECENSISIWYSMKVRGLLQELSKSPSDKAAFPTLLRQLARISCCKARHGDWDRWEIAVFENWKVDLYAAAEREARYLMERKALQDALRLGSQGSRIQRTVAEDGSGFEIAGELAPPAAVRPLPKSRSVMTLRRDPELVRNGPKPIIHCIRHAEVRN